MLLGPVSARKGYTSLVPRATRLGSFTFQRKGVGFGVETMKYENFWEISKFHAGGDDKL